MDDKLIELIIAFIKWLLSQGFNMSDAIGQAAMKFNLSESVISNIIDKHTNK